MAAKGSTLVALNLHTSRKSLPKTALHNRQERHWTSLSPPPRHIVSFKTAIARLQHATPSRAQQLFGMLQNTKNRFGDDAKVGYEAPAPPAPPHPPQTPIRAPVQYLFQKCSAPQVHACSCGPSLGPMFETHILVAISERQGNCKRRRAGHPCCVAAALPQWLQRTSGFRY